MSKRVFESAVLLLCLLCAALMASTKACGQSCVTSAQATLVGNIRGSNGLPVSNTVLTFTPSEAGFIAGCGVNLPVNAQCATSTDGSVVLLQNPLSGPLLTASAGGSLPSGIYYVVIEWVDSLGHVTIPSPESRVTLSMTESLVVNPPAGMPASAVGMQVFIGTSSGGETLQGSTSGSAAFVQSTALISGAAPATTNNTVCVQTANDAIWPTGTGYVVTMTDSTGQPIPGFPMQWQLLGAGTTINLANGWPYYNGVVTYPVPILAQPQNHGQQLISGNLSMTGYKIINVGQLGVGTGTPGWGIDVEGATTLGEINAEGGYLVNGDGGTVGECLGSDGTAYDVPIACLTSIYYQTLQTNGTPLTQRLAANFSQRFTVTDSSSPARTNIDANGSGTGNILATFLSSPSTSTSLVQLDGAGNLEPLSSNACTSYSSSATTGCTVMADGKWLQWATTPSQGANFTGEVTVSLPVTFPTACYTLLSTFVNIGAVISHDGQGYNNYLGSCSTTTVTIEMESGADGVGEYAHTATAFVIGH